MSKLLIRLSLNPDEIMIVQEALARYRRHCEQEIATGEVWPYWRVIQSIRKTEGEIENHLREIDEEFRKWEAKRGGGPQAENI